MTAPKERTVAPRKTRKPTANADVPSASQSILVGPEGGLVMQAMAESLVLRNELAGRFGMSFSGKRDLWTALGYPKVLQYADLDAKYRRGGYGRAAVNRIVRSCWKLPPVISDLSDGTEDTQFEKAWKELAKRKNVIRSLSAVDKLCRIGNFAVLLIGLDDGKTLDLPADKASGITFLRAYAQANATIATYDREETSERYGLPLTYSLQIVNRSVSGNASDAVARGVHWTRVIHVAEDADEDPVFGESTIEIIFNNLMNLELVGGGSAEMFWRGAFPGLALLMDAKTRMTDPQKEAFEKELDEYTHGLKRTLNLRGITPEQLPPAVADPTAHIAIQVDEVCAAIECPKRIFLGSERGELASGADEKNWRATVRYRQENHCENIILRPFVDRLIALGILDSPNNNEYEVAWPDQGGLDPKDAAEVGWIKTQCMAKYTGTPGMDALMPPDMFLELLVGVEPEQIAKLKDFLVEMEKFGSAKEGADAGSETPTPEPADEFAVDEGN